MVGEKLKEVRKKLNFSQEYIALEIGSTQQHLSEVERNKVSPTLAYCEKLATAMRMTPRELFMNIYPQ